MLPGSHLSASRVGGSLCCACLQLRFLVSRGTQAGVFCPSSGALRLMPQVSPESLFSRGLVESVGELFRACQTEYSGEWSLRRAPLERSVWLCPA